jgi:hypothetical protein
VSDVAKVPVVLVEVIFNATLLATLIVIVEVVAYVLVVPVRLNMKGRASIKISEVTAPAEEVLNIPALGRRLLFIFIVLPLYKNITYLLLYRSLPPRQWFYCKLMIFDAGENGVEMVER